MSRFGPGDCKVVAKSLVYRTLPVWTVTVLLLFPVGISRVISVL